MPLLNMLQNEITYISLSRRDTPHSSYVNCLEEYTAVIKCVKKKINKIINIDLSVRHVM